jgi:hypothetical protein
MVTQHGQTSSWFLEEYELIISGEKIPYNMDKKPQHLPGVARNYSPKKPGVDQINKIL